MRKVDQLLQETLAAFAPNDDFADFSLSPLSGGDQVYLLKSPKRRPLCVKIAHDSSDTSSPGSLRAEALGLFSMAACWNAKHSPQPLFWREGYGRQILLLEYLQSQRLPPGCGANTTGNHFVRSRENRSQESGGTSLARILYDLHFQPSNGSRTAWLSETFCWNQKELTEWKPLAERLASGRYLGFFVNNFIGKSRQQNLRKNQNPLYSAREWPKFFAELRLLPMLRLCGTQGLISGKYLQIAEKLCLSLDNFLPRLESASLLHGDLWAGNVLWCGANKKTAFLIDPACYYGHYEVDLAMSRLFGGFPADFYREYRAIKPVDPGWEEREKIYNLYHLLNHLLLFGRSYLGAVQRSIGALS